MVLPVTEDMPPDMLAGSMDLRVVLPDGRAVKMSVERITPMMDLLVQVTTLNKMTPAGYVLQAMGEHGVLPYKPNTPIGALEAWTIHIMPKNKVQVPIVQKKAPLKPANQQQPFEQTFRLQVHLPRNQLYVMRVSPRTLLFDIMQQTCSEKNLDPSKYEMRHPADLSQMLSPSCTLADYGLQEVTVVVRSRGLGQALSSSDIMALQREEEKRRQAVRQQQSSTGLSLMLSKHSRFSVCEGSVSSDSLGGRSISPARSDESASRSASPPAPAMPPPIRPARKRRPAPKPPVQAQKQSVQEEAVNVSHSRNSSDSSGYHEASVLSDGPADVQHMPDTLPRRNKSQAGLSRSMSSLTAATSTASLSGQKKKKAPPPPPVNKTTSLERHLSGKSNSQPLDKCSTLPGKMKMLQQEQETEIVMADLAPVEIAELAPVTSVENVLAIFPVETVPAPVEFASPSGELECMKRKLDSVSRSATLPPLSSPCKRVSLLIPPPVDFLVSHKESSDSWNRFLEDLDRILESRAEYITAPQPSPRTKPPQAEPEYSRFGVGRTMVMLSQSGDSQSSGSWEWRMGADSDDLEINDLDMFDTNPDSQDDAESLFDEARWHTGRGGSLRIPMEVNPMLVSRGSFVSLQSTDNDMSTFSQPRRWKNSEQLATSGWVLGNNSGLAQQCSSSSLATLLKMLPTEGSETSSSNGGSPVGGLHGEKPETEEAIEQVEEAFSCMTTELDEDMNILPPPLSTAEDAVDDWQYQLPAPPTAFRDSDSLERATVDLASTQVFAEPELDVNKSVTRTNPLFIAQEYDVDSIDRNTEQLGVETDKCDLYDNDSSDSATEIKQRSNKTKSRDIGGRVSREDDLGFGQQISEINSRESDTNCTENKKFVEYDDGQLMNGTKCRDSSKYMSDVSQPESTGELPNFTITTYQRPRVIEEIYTESIDDEKAHFTTKPTKLYLHQKFNSTATLNTNLSRTNSFSDEAAKQPPSIKRSTSHISLTFQQNSSLLPSKTKSVSNLAEEEKKDTEAIKDDEHKRLLELQEQFLQLQKQLLQNSSLLEKQNITADAPLQSLQILRNILGQQQVRTRNDPEISEDTQNSKSQQDRQTQSKEDIQIERRNSDIQNSKIIQDRQTNESGKQTSVVTVNNEKPVEPKRYVYRGPPAVNFTTWSERPKSQVSIKMDGDYRIGVGQSNQNKSVQLVNNDTSVPKPAINVSNTKESESSATVALQHNDPSRVPIVRSVELKKSFIEQQNLHKTTTLLNGGSTNQRNEGDTKFVGVNFLAKRFSVGVQPVKAENTVSQKYTSVVGIGPDSAPTVKKTPAVVRVNGFNASKHLMPVVKGFQFAAQDKETDSMPAKNKLQQTDLTDSVSVRSGRTDEPPPLKKSVARPKILPVANPRDQLMDAIKNFGGRENLQQQSLTQDNVVVIR